MSIKRELPIMKASRVYSGPEVRGTRPVLVTFETFKDRDEVLRKVSRCRCNKLVWNNVDDLHFIKQSCDEVRECHPINFCHHNRIESLMKTVEYL